VNTKKNLEEVEKDRTVSKKKREARTPMVEKSIEESMRGGPKFQSDGRSCTGGLVVWGGGEISHGGGSRRRKYRAGEAGTREAGSLAKDQAPVGSRETSKVLAWR